MAFLDEEEDALPLDDAPLAPKRGGRAPRSPRRQILIRRLLAVGAGLLFLILIVLGIRGCLDARKERAIKNFVSDTSALMNESHQVGQDFFGLLSKPTSSSQLTQFTAQVKSYRGACETLYQRGVGLSTPGEMKDPKNAVAIALKMRVEAMTVIANKIDTATASPSAASAKASSLEAQKAIADQMKVLYSSDYVYSNVALPEIQSVLQQQHITVPSSQASSSLTATTLGSTPSSARGTSTVTSTTSGANSGLADGSFIPPPAERWLGLTAVSQALGRVNGTSSATAAPGVHGLALVKTSIGNTQLSQGAPVTVSSAGTPELAVEVQNGGSTAETNVTITVTTGGNTLTGTLPSIAPGATQTVKIPITPLPPTGTQTTVQVSIQPVPGETSSTNNTASYTVTFQ